MPENPEAQEEIAKLVARMRESAFLLSFLADGLSIPIRVRPEVQQANIDLHTGANTIEELEKIHTAAYVVWAKAVHKGLLFSTDPDTGSDKLVGMFVPAHLMNDLGKALVGHAKAMQAVAR